MRVESVGTACNHPQLVVEALDGPIGHLGVQVGQRGRTADGGQ